MEMNRDLLLQLLLHAPDRTTSENLCTAYPELVPPADSSYWTKLIKDRFQISLNLQALYLELLDSDRTPVLDHLKSIYKYNHANVSLTSLWNLNPALLDSLSKLFYNHHDIRAYYLQHSKENPMMQISQDICKEWKFCVEIYFSQQVDLSTTLEEHVLVNFLKMIPMSLITLGHNFD